MTRAANSNPMQRARYQLLYETDPRTGATIEIFHADRVFAGMRGAGWFWWTCDPGSLPEWPPVGPFATAYRAYCDALIKGRTRSEVSDKSASVHDRSATSVQ
jgi:hypothetical protein